MVNASPLVDRRRKRPGSPTTTVQAITNSLSRIGGIPLIIATTCLFSILISLTAPPSESELTTEELRQFKFQNDYHIVRSAKQRRYLLQDGGQDVFDPESGVLSENLWHRQLSLRTNAVNPIKQAEREKKRKEARRLSFGNKNWSRVAMELEEELNTMDGRLMRRMAIIPRYTDKHHFEDCVGTTIEECQSIIDVYVQAHPDDFNNQTTLMMDIRKVRELTDESYYKVVLRTNTAGTKVYGIFDDGVVHYPWSWKVNGVDSTIGPWDCDDKGEVMGPVECCGMIHDDVPTMDDNGNYLACFVEEPVGGPNNPEREDRAIVVTDGNGMVIRAPIAH